MPRPKAEYNIGDIVSTPDWNWKVVDRSYTKNNNEYDIWGWRYYIEVYDPIMYHEDSIDWVLNII